MSLLGVANTFVFGTLIGQTGTGIGRTCPSWALSPGFFRAGLKGRALVNIHVRRLPRSGWREVVADVYGIQSTAMARESRWRESSLAAQSVSSFLRCLMR